MHLFLFFDKILCVRVSRCVLSLSASSRPTQYIDTPRLRLAEKVHIVWSPTAGRFESPVYLICMVSVSFYCIVMTLMLGGESVYAGNRDNSPYIYIIGPIHEFSSNGTCIIGLKPFGYIPLLVYDVYALKLFPSSPI